MEQPTIHWDGTVHSTTNFSVVIVGGGTVGSWVSAITVADFILKVIEISIVQGDECPQW